MKTMNMRNWIGRLGVAAVLALLGTGAHAAAPAAGSVIGNQASATYNDAGGVARTATSNVVQTVVQQVAGLTLTANGAKYSSPGAQVTYPHTLVNTGNGSDSFTLTAANAGGDNFDLSAVAIYEDANGDGSPDNFSNLHNTSVTVARGGVYKFVVVGTVPGTATSGQTGVLTVGAASVLDGAVTASNTDTTTVTANAVITVLKSMSATRALAGATGITVTLAYTNTGNTTATDVTLTDAPPAGMSYTTGTGRWSMTGTTALTDADNATDEGGIVYDYGVTTAGTMTAVIGSVAPGVSGTVTFQISIDAGLAPGSLTNTGYYTFDPDGAGANPPTASVPTNSVTVVIDPTPGVTIADTGAADANADSDGDAANDVAYVATAFEGASVKFLNKVTNSGTGTDTFNISVASLGGAEDFPAGTTFIFYKSDGVAPLTDTNGDGTPDTGPITSGNSYNVYVKAILPPNASKATDNGGDGFRSTVTASSTNGTATDTVVNRIGSISGSSVDITNVDAVGVVGALGGGAGPEGAPVQTKSVTPSATTNEVVFELWVKNTGATGASGDSYNLMVDLDGAFGATNELPAGWSVKFYRDADGDDGNDNTRDAGDVADSIEVTNTGALNLGQSVLIWAVVNVPKNYAAGDVELYFRAVSPSTEAEDVVRDRVTVGAINAVNITPNNAGQVYPGGSVVYGHTVTNAGNGSANVTLSVSDNKAAQGWSSVMYEDTDGSGTLTAGDAVVSSITGLASGANKTIFVKVFAPAGSLEGTVNVTSVSATANAVTATATNATTVIVGDLALSKEQALDANCDGAADTAYLTAQITGAPGDCLLYRVTANNSGVGTITGVVVDDSTPAFTSYQQGAPNTGLCLTGASASSGTVSKPAHNAVGTVSTNIGTMAAGSTVTIEFCVKIDQ